MRLSSQRAYLDFGRLPLGLVLQSSGGRRVGLHGGGGGLLAKPLSVPLGGWAWLGADISHRQRGGRIQLKRNWPRLWRGYRAHLSRLRWGRLRTQRLITQYISGTRPSTPLWYLYNWKYLV